VAPGVPPGSDTSHLALLGYDPRLVYTGRGPFEAAGVGIEVQRGDVAFRCNFATVDDNMKLIDRRAGRIKNGTRELAKELNDIEIEGVRVFFKEGTEHRAALVLRGEGLSPEVGDTDPHVEGLPAQRCKPLTLEAEKTARIVDQFIKLSYEKLSGHRINRERISKDELPANIILTRGAGVFPKVETIEEKYRLKAAVVAGVALVKGICGALGMEVLNVPGATGGLDTDMLAKARAALDAFNRKDMVLVNIKAPDLCGHDGKSMEKVKVLERIDEMLGFFRSNLPEDIVVALTSDHSTPCSLRNHSGDPVPIVILGDGVRVDSVQQFDEVSVACGGLGRILGKDLMPILMDLAGRAEKYGA